MARLQHPNVVAVHDVGLDHGRVFVAMDLVKGIHAAPMACGRAPALARNLTKFGAQPGTACPSVRFGLARPAASTRSARAENPQRMATEQHDGMPATEVADQFAFATALWGAVFGKLPFQGKDIAELPVVKRPGRIAYGPRGKAPRGPYASGEAVRLYGEFGAFADQPAVAPGARPRSAPRRVLGDRGRSPAASVRVRAVTDVFVAATRRQRCGPC
jgi:hypothetical protein